MNVLLVDNFLKRNYSGYFSAYHANGMVSLNAPADGLPGEPTPFTHVIISGSEASILDEDPWILREMEFVREIVHTGIPVLGLCFGHQLIARALFGRDAVGRAPIPEIGWKEVRITRREGILGGLPERISIYNAHFDEVIVRPDMEVLAHSDHCNVQAFKVRGAPAWGLQFHPEIDVKRGRMFIRDIMELFPDMNAELGTALAGEGDEWVGARVFENFYSMDRTV